LILDEYQRSPYNAHPGYQEMFSAIKKVYFWLGMHKDIAEYLLKCI